MRTANSEKPLPHNLGSLRQVFMHVVLVQHRESIFSIYGLLCSYTRNSLVAEKAKKNWLKYTHFTVKKITS